MAKAEKITGQTIVDINDSKVQELIQSGIQVDVTIFQSVIQSYGMAGNAGEPETALYAPNSGAKPSRTAEMYYTATTLVAVQKYYTSLIPMANVKCSRVKKSK